MNQQVSRGKSRTGRLAPEPWTSPGIDVNVPLPHNSQSCDPCDTHLQRAQGNVGGVRTAVQMFLTHTYLNAFLIRSGAKPWNLEEPCVNIACALADHFLFSDLEEGFARAPWFPKRTPPVLVQPPHHRQWAHGTVVDLEDPLLEAVWVLCLQISVFIPVFPGI